MVTPLGENTLFMEPLPCQPVIPPTQFVPRMIPVLIQVFITHPASLSPEIPPTAFTPVTVPVFVHFLTELFCIAPTIPPTM